MAQNLSLDNSVIDVTIETKPNQAPATESTQHWVRLHAGWAKATDYMLVLSKVSLSILINLISVVNKQGFANLCNSAQKLNILFNFICVDHM